MTNHKIVVNLPRRKMLLSNIEFEVEYLPLGTTEWEAFKVFLNEDIPEEELTYLQKNFLVECEVLEEKGEAPPWNRLPALSLYGATAESAAKLIEYVLGLVLVPVRIHLPADWTREENSLVVYWISPEEERFRWTHKWEEGQIKFVIAHSLKGDTHISCEPRFRGLGAFWTF